jgi:uncharacterized protein
VSHHDAVTALTKEQCLDLVAAAPYGRIVYTIDALPAVAPVPFVLADDRLYFQVARQSPLAEASRDAIVAFHVDHVDENDGDAWTVTVTGPARHVLADPLDARPIEVVLTPVVITGFSVRLPAPPVRRSVGNPRNGDAPYDSSIPTESRGDVGSVMSPPGPVAPPVRASDNTT